MAIKVYFDGVNLIRPGSYSDTIVADGSLSAPTLGVVAIVGESSAGIPFASESGISAVTYGPDEFAAIQAKFGSGELVDMAKLAINPSNDPQIKGGAQQLILIKTNATVKAQANVMQGASVYGLLKDKKGGVDGNSISYECAIASGKATITLKDILQGIVEVSAPLGGNTVLTMQCTDGTAATMTIDGLSLTTTLTGAVVAQDLNVKLSGFSSVAKLAEYINAQPGYTATVASATFGNLPVSALDQVMGVNIKTAYAIKKDAKEVADFFAASRLVEFVPSMKAGLPTVQARTFLAGGALGATSMAKIQSGIDALMSARINYVVACFSRDSAEDKAEGVTDIGSEYTIDSIHAALRSHCALASTIKGKKERRAFAGFKGALADAIEKASNANSDRLSLLIQDVMVQNASGELVQKQPHALAVIAAGMKSSAPIGLPLTFKSPNISGFSHVDFDPETMAEQALAANLMFVVKAPNGGYRFELENSTYASDKDAWIYNRPSVQDAADFAALSIRLNTEQFVGQRNSDINESSVVNLLVSVFDSLRTAKVIVPDSKTGGKGYKDLSVRIVGSIIYIDVTLSLVEGYEFVLTGLRVQRAG